MIHHVHQHAIDLVNDLGGGDLAHLQRERLDRLAVLTDDRAHGAQRIPEAAVREPVEKLRCVNGSEVHGAEQDGRHLRRRRRQAKALQRL